MTATEVSIYALGGECLKVKVHANKISQIF